MADIAPTASSALAGTRVVDASNLIAGPLAGMLLADLGADVIKIEHPKGGDSLRQHGPAKDGVPLWWSALGRNKRAVTLYLGDPRGRDLFLRLAERADVVLESYRPGTMERWGLGYHALREVNPQLIFARVTGFGQRGPLADRPGFGTLAESQSGYAFRNGMPDSAPVLPPFGLADSVTGMTLTIAILAALHARAQTGRGQEIDVAIIEPLLTVLSPQDLVYDQLGEVMTRMGNGSAVNAPRGIYQASDGHWVAISTSTQSTADRLLTLVGREDVLQEPWFRSAHSRAQHSEELDRIVGDWIAAHTSADALAACAEAGAPAALVQSVREIFADEQYEALGSIASVPHPKLGRLRMANTPFRMSETPPSIRWAGPELGEHNAEVYGELGVTAEELEALSADGIV